jgi:soluble P-type ATPase
MLDVDIPDFGYLRLDYLVCDFTGTISLDGTLPLQVKEKLNEGLNDRGMLETARLEIIVVGSEGCAVESLLSSDIQVVNVVDGLNLLICPRRLRATLKF